MSKIRTTSIVAEPISFGWACLAVAAAGLLAHGIVVFTDYILWDGYWYYAELVPGVGAPGMKRLFSEIGRPLDYYFLLPFTVFTGAVAPKIASLVAWVLVPIPLMIVLREGAKFPAGLAFAVALVSAVLPVFDVLGEIALFMNVFALLIFWCGMAALVRLSQKRGVRALVWRIAAILLLLAAFNLNSLLVFFYGLVAFLFACRIVLSPRRDILTYGFSLLCRFADFFALPVIFWVLKSVLTPVHGYYVGHNMPVFSAERAVSGVLSLVAFVQGEAVEFFSSGVAVGVALVAALVVAVGLGARSALREGKIKDPRLTAAAFVSLFGGIVLLLAAAFPYAVVDQPLASFGWVSRNCILTPFPLALILCGFFLALNQLFLSHRPSAWTVPIVFIVVLGIFVSNRNYMQWQALGAKQDSIGLKMRAALETSKAVVVQMRDYFMIPDTIYYYAPIVWTYVGAGNKTNPETFVFDTAQSIPHQEMKTETGESRIVFPQVPVTGELLGQMIEQTTMPYMLRNIPLTGPQIMFIVQQGKLGNDGVSLGARYLWLKWFNPDGLPEFLDQVTETHVLELPPVTSA
ncbi:MAG: hypothetical protein ACKOFH_06725 [Chthoniobacterales bacterium]